MFKKMFNCIVKTDNELFIKLKPAFSNKPDFFGGGGIHSYIQQNFSAQKKHNGVKHYYQELAKYVPYFEFGTLTIIGGRPGMCKTTFLVNLDMVKQRPSKDLIPNENENTIFVFLSLEMRLKDIKNKIFSSLLRIPTEKISSETLNTEESEKYVNTIEKSLYNARSQFDIFDQKKDGYTVNDVKDIVHEYITRSDKKICLLIDSLGLIQSGKSQMNTSLYQEVSNTIRTLHTLARMNNDRLCIICTSQLSRERSNTQSKSAKTIQSIAVPTPMIHNLRDSGWIEECADLVLLLHREYFYIKQDRTIKEQNPEEWQKLVNEKEHELLIKVEKNRTGEMGQAHLYVDLKTAYVGNVEKSEEKTSNLKQDTIPHVA